MLPHEFQDTIHKLFVIMQATHISPIPWKISNTILIDKNRGAETDISSYRPIGLANTLHKLWNQLVNNAPCNYTEAHFLLSSIQAGFPDQKDAIQQLQIFTMVLRMIKSSRKTFLHILLTSSQLLIPQNRT